MLTTTQLLVQSVLRCPRMEWSIQGFGMLRAYLSKEVRLHVWNPEFAVPNVSSIHDHPWSFVSEVVCGEIENHRYSVHRRMADGRMRDDPEYPIQGTYPDAADTHLCAVIRCGTGGGIDKACNVGGPEPRTLVPWSPFRYTAGQRYDQMASDVHETHALAGTVTIITRKFQADTEHARVFFPLGTEWVSAEPRPANAGEVRAFTEPALALLEGLR